ncbi:MAG TPA: hypothetical protein VL461_12355 [Dictyobacter sp.]|nr:hypothetical protein [Dictyobacter sp.]
MIAVKKTAIRLATKMASSIALAVINTMTDVTAIPAHTAAIISTKKATMTDIQKATAMDFAPAAADNRSRP